MARKKRSIRSRRGRRKLKSEISLQLTSMIDILIIVVVFLLKSYSTTFTSFSTVEGIKLPVSQSPDFPPETLQVIVTPSSITFDDEKVLEFLVTEESLSSDVASYEFKDGDLDEGKLRIIPLYDALVRAKQRAEILEAKSPYRDTEGNVKPFHGTIAIQADKRVRYETIRKIMYTSATAGYQAFRFLAMKLPE